jgi:hypothetical protein
LEEVHPDSTPAEEKSPVVTKKDSSSKYSDEFD